MEYNQIITSEIAGDRSKKPSIKVAFAGNVDSGKSTLVGVLTKKTLDDGRGSARLKVFNYPHEAANGRTSSIGIEIMGFLENGEQFVPERYNAIKNKYWPEIVKKSDRIVTLIDLCGHEAFLKTTMFGLVGMIPDYVMIIVGANMGISRMTKEHLGITLALKIPFFVVVTKIDMCPQNIYDATLESLLKILKSSSCNKKALVIKNDEDITFSAENLADNHICPIFTVSSVSGENIDKLTIFISRLRNRTTKHSAETPAQFHINENFLVNGVGIVISGVMTSGTIKNKDILLLGPDKSNSFMTVKIKTIHINRVLAEEAYAEQYASFAVTPVNTKDTLTRDDFRKGMVLLDPSLKPELAWEFEAKIYILHHSTTMYEGYQAVVHCGVIRQCATLMEFLSEDKKYLRTGDRANVRFKFMFNPEFLKPDLQILLRDGNTKILGSITKVQKINPVIV